MPYAKAQSIYAEPPDPGDVPAWLTIVARGSLDDYPPGLIVRTFRLLLPDGSQELKNALGLHLSNLITAKLRRKVKTSYPDKGHAIIEDAHDRLCAALFDHESADGLALVEHFEERLHYRCLDALKRFHRSNQVVVSSLTGEDGEEREADEGALASYTSIDVGHTLATIGDLRKRTAFSLKMEGHPIAEIASLLKIDKKTLYRWIEEVRAFLKTELDL